jgi:hypothetical protein
MRHWPPIRALILTVLGATVIALMTAAAAAAQPLSFGPPVKLPTSPPGDNTMPGGEPSVAYDPSGDGHVYVVAPGGNGRGIGFWASNDHGATWPIAKSVGSPFPIAGGEDSDIEVGIDHTVYAADLEIVANAICRSHDFGKTFGDNCETNIPTNQQGPEADREWISHDPNDPKVLYITYHDVSAEFPIIEKSTDGGATFSPCGSIFQPGREAQQKFGTGGTDVGKPVIGNDGSIYVPITEPDSPLATGAYNNFFVAVAKGGCDGTTVFTDYKVWDDPGANLANIFSDLAIDKGGTLYAASAGLLNASQKNYGIFLFTSQDGGKTWTPHQVNTPNLTANVLPALAGGNARNQVALGWYGSENATDPNNTNAQWRYYAATSFDGGNSFEQATVTPTVFHFGDVCTIGILCTTGNRNLLDFTSIGVDPADGSVMPVFPGDPYDTPDNQTPDAAAVYVAHQTAGAKLAVAASPPPPVLPAPPKRGCVDRRRFTFKLHRAKRTRITSVDVYVNGKHRLHRHGHDIRSVTLKKLPKGTFTVRIVAHQSSGSTLTSVRTYKGCKKSRPHTKGHHHKRH